MPGELLSRFHVCQIRAYKFTGKMSPNTHTHAHIHAVQPCAPTLPVLKLSPFRLVPFYREHVHRKENVKNRLLQHTHQRGIIIKSTTRHNVWFVLPHTPLALPFGACLSLLSQAMWPGDFLKDFLCSLAVIHTAPITHPGAIEGCALVLVLKKTGFFYSTNTTKPFHSHANTH